MFGGDTIQYKDIEFTLSKLGKIDANVERGDWSLSIVNDMTIEDENVVKHKPKSFSTPSNSWSPLAIRNLNFNLEYKGEYAANFTLEEYENYLFIFDMRIDEDYRGLGGGNLLMDLYKAAIIFTGHDYAGGFVGDGNTKQFLKANGFSKAHFETWTNGMWGSEQVSGEFVLTEDYYDYPESERFGLVPTPTDIDGRYSMRDYVISPTDRGNRWTLEAEERMIEEAPEGVRKSDMIIFAARVRRDIAEPFWEGGWSTHFKIPTHKIEFEDSVFPVAQRPAPVLERFRDPTYSIFDL